ncbi:DUF7693 family protein [Pseudomonas capeferrum]|uniref:DUF7693 family protein n=1 Tax=Pseudomonas capeferrum TaxID=1495066 RepID=UPI003BB81498
MSRSGTVSTREAYQRLRDAALGVHALQISATIEGWQMTLAVDAEGLAHCVHCQAPNGDQAGLEDWYRYGTNPADLLSLWERTQLETRLAR